MVLVIVKHTGQRGLVVLVELTAAFDTVDYDVLLWHLENLIGIKGTAYDGLVHVLRTGSFL